MACLLRASNQLVPKSNLIAKAVGSKATRCLSRGVGSQAEVEKGDNKALVGGKRDWELTDIKTHTGQVFDEGDARLTRFVGKTKEVNTRFAIDLIAEAAPIASTQRVTHCDGGDGPLGHPRVFINLDQPGNHSCGYCGLRFYLDAPKH